MKETVTVNKKNINIKIVNIKDNISIVVKGYKTASYITDVSVSTIKSIIDCSDKTSKGYKFYRLD